MPSSLAAGDVLGALIVAVAPLSGAGFGLIRGLASLRGSAVAAADPDLGPTAGHRQPRSAFPNRRS